jgi:hypothetical protein
MSSFLFQKKSQAPFQPSVWSNKPSASASEVWEFALQDSIYNELFVSDLYSHQDAWQPYIDLIQERDGITFDNPGDSIIAEKTEREIYEAEQRGEMIDPESSFAYSGTSDYGERANKIRKHILDNQDRFPEVADFASRNIEEEAKNLARSKRQQYMEVEGRSYGATNWLVGMGAGVASAAYDPFTYLTLPSGLYSAGAKTLGSLLLREFVVGAGVTALLQPRVASWYEELGYEYGWEDFVTRTAAGGAFSAIFSGTMKLTADQVKKGIKAYKDSGLADSPSADAKAAEVALEKLEDLQTTNPLEDLPLPLPLARWQKEMDRLLDIEAGYKISWEEVKKQQAELWQPVLDAYERGEITIEERNAQLAQITKDLDVNGIKKLWDQSTKNIDDWLTKQNEIDEAWQGARANLEHAERSAAATEAVVHNKAPNIPEKPISPINEAIEESSLPIWGGDDLRSIQVDAETFQFKSGGDRYGVLPKFADVTQWDQNAADPIMVWQRSDGANFVADGHQRLGLAKRIMDTDPAQEPRLPVIIFRETDGFSAEDLRYSAAIKNIRQGTGSALDAARVFKMRPEDIEKLSFGKESAIARQGRAIMAINEELWPYMINGLVPMNYGAVIGQLIPDDAAMQEAAFKVLARIEPNNEFQATQIVKDVKVAGYEKVTQEGLFGAETFIDSYFEERAVILDRAQKQIRKDKAAFNNIVRNASRLEEEGNVVIKENNRRRITDEEKTLEILTALANARGPISSALTDAAKIARESGKYDGAVEQFLGSVRRAVDEGEFDRYASGDDFVHSRNQAEVSERPQVVQDEDFSLFDDVVGEGATKQAADAFEEVRQNVAKSIGKFDEDAYIELINPGGLRVPEVEAMRLDSLELTDLTMDEAFDFPISTVEIARVDGVIYMKDRSGPDIFAMHETEDLILGYWRRYEGGVQGLVATDFQGRGIGSTLSYLYRSQNPKAQSGGLTAAGEAVARKVFRQMAAIRLKPDPSLYFDTTGDYLMVSLRDIKPIRARGEGIFNAKVFMSQAEEGLMEKRMPVEAKDLGDGTYELRDGNSTYSVAVDSGWESMPIRVTTDEEFASATSEKAMANILRPGAKEKPRYVDKQESDKVSFGSFMNEVLHNQEFESFDSMMTRGAANHQALNEAVEKIANDLGLEFKPKKDDAGKFLVPPVKEADATIEKLVEKYKADPDNLLPSLYNVTDIARTGMTVYRPEDARAVLKKLNEDYKWHIIDEGWGKTPVGYFDAKALVIMPDGMLAEIQFWPPGMLDAKNTADLTRFGYEATYVNKKGETKPYTGGHKLYELWRALKRDDDGELINEADIDVEKRLSTEMRTLYQEVADELPSTFDSMLATLEIDRRLVPSLSARDAASAADISGDLSSINIREAPLPDLQAPARPSHTDTTSLSTSHAASDMPSTMKNLTSNTSEFSVTDLVNETNDPDGFPTAGIFVDEDAQMQPRMQTFDEMQKDFEMDDALIERFKDCV